MQEIELSAAGGRVFLTINAGFGGGGGSLKCQQVIRLTIDDADSLYHKLSAALAEAHVQETRRTSESITK